MCYWCEPCDAYVGCHNNTRNPLGTMANKELREWRRKAHAVFDPLWREGHMSRKKAYQRLKDKMGHTTHIGESDVQMCKQIIKVMRDF